MIREGNQSERMGTSRLPGDVADVDELETGLIDVGLGGEVRKGARTREVEKVGEK